jgi:hypothetical protein
MPVFMLGDAILFRCVWVSYTMLNSVTGDETRETTILAAPVRLKGTYFSVKEQLDMLLKQMKSVFNIGFAIEKVNPCKPAKIIQETNIILKATNR